MVNGWKLALYVIGGITIIASNKLQMELFGVGMLVVAGLINKKQVIVRRIKG